MGPVYLLAVILGGMIAESLPGWAWPAVVAAFVVSVTSVVALWAGLHHLRGGTTSRLAA
ncbi:MAG: hypothetical protein ACRDQT_11015 [Gaiellaceae bacterium]